MTLIVASGPAGAHARLLSALERHVDGHRIRAIECLQSDYRSSAALYEVTVRFDDGPNLELMAKAADWHALTPAAQLAKPEQVWNDERELTVYADILCHFNVGTPRYFGLYHDEYGVRHLLLERIEGVPLWQCGEFDAWRSAARWLARLHHSVDATRITAVARQHLLTYDRAFYETWMERARTFVSGAQRPNHLCNLCNPVLEEVARCHQQVTNHLLSLPAAFIHGEFYSANVLARFAQRRFQIRPIDWEMAAVAPPLVDLAQLASGRWSDDQRADLADAYHEELAALGGHVPPRDEYLRTLDACLIHLSVQNLGWSGVWKPPPDQAHDWLGEALRLGEKWR